MALILELHHFPCLEYFKQLLKADVVCLEAHENFQKQTYRNRFRILTSNKIDVLTVPVKKANSRLLIKDVEIDYSHTWQRQHWRAIQSAYGKAAYYEHLSDYFRVIYDKNHKYLWDLNIEALTVCLKLLQIDTKLMFTNEYNKFDGELVNNANDKRSVIGSEISHSDGIRYTQVFGKDFVPNLSVIDLILNEGPNGKTFLR